MRNNKTKKIDISKNNNISSFTRVTFLTKKNASRKNNFFYTFDNIDDNTSNENSHNKNFESQNKRFAQNLKQKNNFVIENENTIQFSTNRRSISQKTFQRIFKFVKTFRAQFQIENNSIFLIKNYKNEIIFFDEFFRNRINSFIIFEINNQSKRQNANNYIENQISRNFNKFIQN